MHVQRALGRVFLGAIAVGALGALGAGPVSIAAQQPGVADETLLYEAPPGFEPENRRVLPGLSVMYGRWWTFWGSADGQRVAMPAKREGKWSLLGAGTPSGEYDEIEYAVFSPDSRRLAVLARRGKQWRVTLDGVEGPEFEQIVQVLFSPDSKRLMYAGVRRGVWRLVDNGSEQGSYQKINWFAFSSDGARFVCGVKRRERWVVLADGVEGPEWDDVWYPNFTADGKRLVYGARKDDAWRVVLDGREGPPFKSVLYPAVSRDGARLAYMALPSHADAIPKLEYFSLKDSPAGIRQSVGRAFILDTYKPSLGLGVLSNVAGPWSWWIPVVDGVSGPTAAVIAGPIFDSTGTRVVHLAGDHLAVGVYVNGTKVVDVTGANLGLGPLVAIPLQTFVLSPDGSRLGAAFRFAAQLPGRTGPLGLGKVFTSGHFAAVVTLGDTVAAPRVKAGPLHATGRLGAISNPQFSPDGRHFGYEIVEEEPPVFRVWVDERGGPGYDQLLRGSLRVTDDSVSYVARRDRRFVRVSQPIPVR